MRRFIMRRLTVYFIIFGSLLSFALIFIEKAGFRNAISGLIIPQQTALESAEPIRWSRSGYDIVIQPKYAYTLEGLVTHTKDYDGDTPPNNISPKDIAVAWGKVAEYNKKIDFKWSQNNRFAYNEISNSDADKYLGGASHAGAQFSNNHLIPANSDVAKEVDMIRSGDHIIIEGYLVNTTFYREGKVYSRWNSSTTRYDSGDHACEIIYVTNVKWVV